MALITCENVSFAFDGETVVGGLNFSVSQGDYLCIVGENGSGKSTLIRGLLGLLRPASGRILLGDGLRQKEIGYLPQQTVVQKDFPASVFEVALSGCLNACRGPFYRRCQRLAARQALAALGIADQAGRCYRDLSGGQQQRVLLARALCATQKLLLLDEPVSGLDPAAAAEMYTHIFRLNRAEGVAVVMVSHDIHEAVAYASHILHLAHSKPLFFGTAADYAQSAAGRHFLKGELHG